MKNVKKFLITVLSIFTLTMTAPFTVVNAQEGGGTPNPAQVEQIISQIEDDLTPEQREMVREAQKENNRCVAMALVAGGFGATGGATGSISAFLSTLTTCHI